MREIEGIKHVVDYLRPHWPEIDAYFMSENAKFLKLMDKSSETIGRILKCHLIVENYLDRFLTTHYGIENYSNIHFSFYIKALMLPSKSSSAAFVKPGIIELNSIRNNYAHNLSTDISFRNNSPILEVLSIARPNKVFEKPIEAIEAFTTIACTWLIIPPPNLQKLFSVAFSKIRVNVQ